jgi:hypothetical protein
MHDVLPTHKQIIIDNSLQCYHQSSHTNKRGIWEIPLHCRDMYMSLKNDNLDRDLDDDDDKEEVEVVDIVTAKPGTMKAKSMKNGGQNNSKNGGTCSMAITSSIVSSQHLLMEIVLTCHHLLSQPGLCLPFIPLSSIQSTILLLHLTQEVLIEGVSSNISILYNLVKHVIVVQLSFHNP